MQIHELQGAWNKRKAAKEKERVEDLGNTKETNKTIEDTLREAVMIVDAVGEFG